MYNNLQIRNRFLSSLIILIFLFITTQSLAQDTIAGSFTSLFIKSGHHVVKNVVTVKGNLEIQPGASIELLDLGLIVCEGSVNITGESGNRIEFFGKSNLEGIGLLFRGLDSNSNSAINIKNTTFKSLQLPLFFEFGWKRSKVNISYNNFINNIGKISLIQVSNPPYNLNLDTCYINFIFTNNLISGNNAALYFEDLKSDVVEYDICNNTFVGNNIYGFKNYNISTNILYARVDESFSKFPPKITNNSFAFNYLIDNISDSFVHLANFGVYGTEKYINVKNNYFGSAKKEVVQKSIYDRTLNYNSPQVEYDPFLLIPSESIPSHVYSISNLNNSYFDDNFTLKESLNGFILYANNNLNYSKSVLEYKYFSDDSSLNLVDTVLTFDVRSKGNSSEFEFSKNYNFNKNIGYYTLRDIVDSKGNYVPEVKVGYIAYSNDLRRRKVLSNILKEKRINDTFKVTSQPYDSIKNQFQKIEAPLKSRFEFCLYSGITIFNGTISQNSFFSNDKNLYNGFNINYTLYSNLSASLTISKFKLSNSDVNSNNNDQQARGMSFLTTIFGISTSLNYDFIDNRLYTKAKKFRPSLGFGLDVNSFSPTGIYNGVKYKLQPLGTGGQLVDSDKQPYSTLALGYFMNFKMKYQINRYSSVGIHISIHKSGSDYLDDVGPDLYPSYDKIMNSQVVNKDAALFFSNPTARNVQGQYRNNPNNSKDGYVNFGLFYSIKIFK